MNKAYLGKWRIKEMDLWDEEFIDLDGPGYADGMGDLAPYVSGKSGTAVPVEQQRQGEVGSLYRIRAGKARKSQVRPYTLECLVGRDLLHESQ